MFNEGAMTREANKRPRYYMLTPLSLPIVVPTPQITMVIPACIRPFRGYSL